MWEKKNILSRKVFWGYNSFGTYSLVIKVNGSSSVFFIVKMSKSEKQIDRTSHADWGEQTYRRGNKPSWEKQGDPVWFGVLERLVQDGVVVIPGMEKNLSPLILDCGSGTGTKAISFARRYPQAHVIGVDISGSIVKQSNSLAEREGMSERVRFIKGDILEYLEQSDDNLFSLVMDNCCSLHFLPEGRQDFLQQLQRVLKPGGIIGSNLFSAYDLDFHGVPSSIHPGYPNFFEYDVTPFIDSGEYPDLPPEYRQMHNAHFREEDIDNWYKGRFFILEKLHVPHPSPEHQGRRYLWEIVAQNTKMESGNDKLVIAR